MEQYFGPQGLLAKKLKLFEFRPPQLEMAQAVHECLSENGTLFVEAGTGTGKTWGYLIPAILSGKTVVVSTGTKTLQDQILDHDVPLLRRILFPQLKAVCLKGRKNYLCLRRFRDFSYQPSLFNREEAKLFRRFQTWAARTTTGDRAEIDWLPDRYNTWHEVSSSGEQCLGQLCEENSRCFLGRLRAEASRARLIVVNHHLFFADLFLRSRHLGEVIPEYDAVILDEAHQIEDIAGLYFGLEFSSTSIQELARDILKEFSRSRTKEAYPREAQQIVQQLDVLGRQLHHQLQKARGVTGRFPLTPESAGEGFVTACRRTIHALEQLGATLSPFADRDAAVEAFCRRSGELAGCARHILEQRDPTLVYWYECTPQAVFMRGTPIQVGDVLRDLLFTRKRAAILTSATLAVAGSLDYLKRTLGAGEEAREVVLPSPFAFDRQALLYIPLHTPSPQDPAFCGHVADQAAAILSRTRGRALFLFTSYRHMNDVYGRLKDRLPFPLLAQGQKPKRVLLAEFKERIDSILLATSS
ncbi:MAG: ATP-dependent DNA helicase, partial [Syntrophobacteraceae bacterium]|nr:ATP-dependent DNA helicase [Syntrophobacteraceae bacterium]